MQRAAVVWVLLLIAFLSCSRQKDLQLRVVHQAPVVTLDPQTTDDFVSLSVLSNVYETLVRFDDKLKLTPRLAIAWNNPDEYTWRFELRRNVMFHDGQSFSAYDVKYTIDRGMEDPNSFIKAEIPEVQNTRVLDDRTVEITTRKPFPLLLAKMSYIMIIPRGSERYIRKRSNGTGPYRLSTYLPNKMVELERFEKYWGRRPQWNRALVTWKADARERLREVEQGKVDIAEAPPEAELFENKTAQMIQHSSLGVMFLGFSVTDAPQNPFTDAQVRKAIALSIDQAGLIEKTLLGRAEPASQLAPHEAFGFVPEFPVPKPDPAQARRLLKESRFSHGFRQPLYFVEAYKEIASYLAELVKPLGIQFDLQMTDRAGLDQMLFDQKARAYLLQYSFPSMDSSDLLYFGFHTKTSDRNYGVLNFSGYSNSDLDRILEESSTEMDPKNRYLLLKEGMRMALDSNVWIPLCVPLHVVAASKRVDWGGNSFGRVIFEEITLVE